MTTLAQGDLDRDADVLRSIARHNPVRLGDRERPCLGVYAAVLAGGTINRGDPVRLE
jgi:hypothetical protein